MGKKKDKSLATHGYQPEDSKKEKIDKGYQPNDDIDPKNVSPPEDGSSMKKSSKD